MDEVIFKNHAEKEFWEKVFLSLISDGHSETSAATAADTSVLLRRIRMTGLVKPPGVKAA